MYHCERSEDSDVTKGNKNKIKLNYINLGNEKIKLHLITSIVEVETSQI